LFILGYASTWGPGIWILTGETFPLRTRAKQAALATASNWLWKCVKPPPHFIVPSTDGKEIHLLCTALRNSHSFLLAFFTPFITRDIAYRYGFIFASCNLFAAVFVYLFLYESAGLSLEAVDTMYSDPDSKVRARTCRFSSMTCAVSLY